MAKQNFEIVIKAFDKTARGLGSATRGIKAVAGAALNLKTALVGTAGIAGMGLLIKSSLDATDSLGKTARKIGVTTEALASMRYAAKLTGVETATMDMALQRFTRRAAEAAMGTGEAKNALLELGIDAQKIIKLPLEEQMVELARAFETVGSDADKVRLAMKLFDSEGVALVNTLGVGADALIGMAEEAEQLGIALSASTVQGVEDANDAFTKLGTLFKGVRDQTVGALAPALEQLASFLTSRFKNAIEESGGTVEQFGRNMALNVLQAVESVVTAVAKMANTIGKFFFEMDAKINSFKADKSVSEIQRLQKELDILNRVQPDVEEGFGLAFVDRIKLFGMNVDNNLDAVNAGILSRTEQFETTMQNLFSGGQEQQTWEDIIGIESFREVMAEMYETLNQAPEVGQRFSDEFVGPLQENLSQMSSAIQQQSLMAINGVMAQSQAMLGNLLQATEKGSSAHKALFLISKGVAVAQAIIGAKLAGINTLLAYTNLAAVTPPPANIGVLATGKVMAGAVTAMGYANAAIIAGTALKSYDGGGFTGRGARSGGVDGKGGFNAILHPNETVIDHTRGGGQGVVVNQTINVTTGVQQTVRAEIQNLLPQIQDAAKGAVLAERRRGGGYSTGILGR